VAYTERIGPEGCDLLRIAGIDGSQQRILYPNQDKSLPNEKKSVIRDLGWSPDSQHVLAAFYSGESRYLADYSDRIAAVAVADGSPRVLKTLTPEEHNLPRVRLSPDGHYVAYCRVPDAASQQEDVFLIPLDGGPEIHLIESPADDHVFGCYPMARTSSFAATAAERGRMSG